MNLKEEEVKPGELIISIDTGKWDIAPFYSYCEDGFVACDPVPGDDKNMRYFSPRKCMKLDKFKALLEKAEKLYE